MIFRIEKMEMLGKEPSQIMDKFLLTRIKPLFSFNTSRKR